ncbi:MAG: hypothetical protein O6826_00160 [Acidobacteria bacterium]|nr:hypothetical protein [Acidobacteriota bacterium]
MGRLLESGLGGDPPKPTPRALTIRQEEAQPRRSVLMAEQSMPGGMPLRLSVLFLTLALLAAAAWGGPVRLESFAEWSLSEAVEILNSSAWARNETFTRVVRGVGSGVSGEKEIYNTFFVRFLSARPIREAYTRVQQIQFGYDQLTEEEKRQFDELTRPGLELDVENWIVVAVSFRSNDPEEESQVRQFFESETTQTLRNRAFLSTEQFSQVELSAYFPPREEGVGAKFVFPREVDGIPVVSPESEGVTFELLEVPGASPQLRATFLIKGMVLDGELVL